MLQQRSDLYSVAYFLDDHETARYQVFINLLIFCQFGASLLLSPFAKNIFRITKKSFLKLEKKFMTWGVLLSAVSITAVYLLTQFFYGFTLSWKMFALGYVYVLMFYLYLLRNYELGKLRKQTRVALYSFAASGFNLILSFFLTPNLGIEGALLAGTFAQLFLVALYHQKKFVQHATS
jgi:hypothetical protein